MTPEQRALAIRQAFQEMDKQYNWTESSPWEFIEIQLVHHIREATATLEQERDAALALLARMGGIVNEQEKQLASELAKEWLEKGYFESDEDTRGAAKGLVQIRLFHALAAYRRVVVEACQAVIQEQRDGWYEVLEQEDEQGQLDILLKTTALGEAIKALDDLKKAK